MNKLVFLFLTMIFAGCQTYANYIPQDLLSKDPQLEKAAFELLKEYLDQQKMGEPYQAAAAKYGKGVPYIYNLIDYKIMGTSWYVDWGKEYPVVCVRLKMGIKLGGIVWESHRFLLSYSAQMRQMNDKFLGLRIKKTYQAWDF